MPKKLCDVDGFIFDILNVVILLQKYTGKTKITRGNHRVNTGDFAFRDEWEPCTGEHEYYVLGPQISDPMFSVFGS